MAASIACQTRSGVAGISISVTPTSASASMIALTAAGFAVPLPALAGTVMLIEIEPPVTVRFTVPFVEAWQADAGS